MAEKKMLKKVMLVAALSFVVLPASIDAFAYSRSPRRSRSKETVVKVVKQTTPCCCQRRYYQTVPFGFTYVHQISSRGKIALNFPLGYKTVVSRSTCRCQQKNYYKSHRSKHRNFPWTPPGQRRRR